MKQLAEQRNIDLRNIPPLQPSANPAETFMKPLCKALKIGTATGRADKETLQLLLDSYSNTPHPATGLPPAALFPDAVENDDVFPTRHINAKDIEGAKRRDIEQKIKNEDIVKASKYRKKSILEIGGIVLLRNYKKTVKFDPIFLPEPCTTVDIDSKNNHVTVQYNNLKLQRHVDDTYKFISWSN